MKTRSLSERIAELKEIEIGATEYEVSWIATKGIEIIEELQAENQALLAKNGELAKQIDEEKLRTFVHQADSNCAKNDRQSNRIFYQECLKNVKFERDCLQAKVKELEEKGEIMKEALHRITEVSENKAAAIAESALEEIDK